MEYLKILTDRHKTQQLKENALFKRNSQAEEMYFPNLLTISVLLHFQTKHLVITYSVQTFFRHEKWIAILKINGRWKKTFETVKLGATLVEIMKSKRNVGDKVLPGPWGFFSSSLEITALGNQKCFQNILISLHIIS